MYGNWQGYDAIALVDNEEHEQELLEKGYTYEQEKETKSTDSDGS
jgi:hypothetical protein